MSDSNPSARRPRVPLLVPWLVVGVTVITALWLGARLVVLLSEKRLWEQRAAIASVSLKAAEAQIEGEQLLSKGLVAEIERQQGATSMDQRVTVLVAPRPSPVPSAFGAVAYSPARGQGVLLVSALPRLEAGQAYALWTAGAPAVRVMTLPSAVDAPWMRQFTYDASTSPSPGFMISRDSTEAPAAGPETIVLSTP